MYVLSIVHQLINNSIVLRNILYKNLDRSPGVIQHKEKELAAVARDRHQAEKRRKESDPGKIDNKSSSTYGVYSSTYDTYIDICTTDNK